MLYVDDIYEKVSSIGGKGDDVAERFEDGEGFEDKDDVI